MPRDAAPVLIDQILMLWVLPEIERRRADLGRDDIRAALVVLSPNSGVSVHINEEASFVADIQASWPMSEGEAVSSADVTEILGLRPINIDPDAGWVGFTDVGSVRLVAFDFRRNRKRAQRLITLADEYLETAVDATGLKRYGPAIENAFAAAELGVTAQLLLMDDTPTKQHPEKRRWFTRWSELGNVPEAHSKALSSLGSLRRHARYGDRQLDLGESAIRELIADVHDLVSFARNRVEEGPESEIVG